MRNVNRCELCKREVAKLTRHHLIPRARHKSIRKREGTDRTELNRVIEVCGPCHRNIHAVLTEKELEAKYDTSEKLAAYPGVKRFTEWVSKQADAPIRVRSSKAKSGRYGNKQ